MFRATGRVLRGAAVAVVVLLAYGYGMLGGGRGDHGDAVPGAVAAGDAPEDPARWVAAAARGGTDRRAVEAMLRRLGDRWARYYSAEDYADHQRRLNGRHGGVGLWLAPGGPDGRDGDARVRGAGVRPGSSAARAGVRGGDVVLRVDGASVAGWDVTRVARALRGAPGTRVALTVEHGSGGQRRERRLLLYRAEMTDPAVVARDLPDRVRSIRVTGFTRGAGRLVRREAARDPHRRDGILLDLRGNPGGLLSEAVETSSAFLAGGPVVTYERTGRPPQRLDVTAPGDTGTPLVVLVDGGTASAAEVVAAALRDRRRAVIVGSRTYGKATVQEPVRLPDGAAVSVTAGRYRTPGGRNLDGVGIAPDVAVSADRPPGAAEQRARAVLRGLLATLPEARSGGVTERDRG
ncbi:S41 family peptidase [Actinomadura kijaniata]|uniref:S41 family peptidase n=1 Tax=Actinomadura kijaniata TaxID=46161 RepID=UPI003F1CFABC